MEAKPLASTVTFPAFGVENRYQAVLPSGAVPFDDAHVVRSPGSTSAPHVSPSTFVLSGAAWAFARRSLPGGG